MGIFKKAVAPAPVTSDVKITEAVDAVALAYQHAEEAKTLAAEEKRVNDQMATYYATAAVEADGRHVFCEDLITNLPNL